MSRTKLLLWMGWMLVAGYAPVALAQSAAVAADSAAVAPGAAGVGATTAAAAATAPGSATAKPAEPKAAQLWPKRTVSFFKRTAVLGLPSEGGRAKPHCSADGMEYFDLAPGLSGDDAEGMRYLFSVSPEGEAKRIARKLPISFASISVEDFFAGEQKLVTLLKATKRQDGGDTSAPPREAAYFLSESDGEGDSSSLVQLDVRFRPLKVASFRTGDVLLLGWEESNMLPVLALIKDDGTVGRFFDLEERRGAQPEGTRTAAAAGPSLAHVDLTSLGGATFVALSDELLLTFPGTNRPVYVLGAVGDIRSIAMGLPGGFTMHDVLGPNGSSTLVVRAQASTGPGKAAKGDGTENGQQRLFDLSAANGALLNEIVFDKPRVADVTCAAKSSLTAMYLDTPAGSDSSGANPGAANVATQLVMVSTR